jgi:DNA repair photolyase
MAPILPGISDRPEQIAEVVRAARKAGACGVWTNLLFLRPGTREHFMANLQRDWPELVPEYEGLYRRNAYLGAAEARPVKQLVSSLAKEFGVRDRRTNRLRPAREPEQLELAV